MAVCYWTGCCSAYYGLESEQYHNLEECLSQIDASLLRKGYEARYSEISSSSFLKNGIAPWC